MLKQRQQRQQMQQAIAEAEARFNCLVNAEVERHSRHRAVMPNNQSENKRHRTLMIQYAAELLRVWTRSASVKAVFQHTASRSRSEASVSAPADDASIGNIRYFIQHEAGSLWDVRAALFPSVGNHYSLNDAQRRDYLLPSIAAFASRIRLRQREAAASA